MLTAGLSTIHYQSTTKHLLHPNQVSPLTLPHHAMVLLFELFLVRLILLSVKPGRCGPLYQRGVVGVVLARLLEEHGELLQYPRRERELQRLNVKVVGASSV